MGGGGRWVRAERVAGKRRKGGRARSLFQVDALRTAATLLRAAHLDTWKGGRPLHSRTRTRAHCDDRYRHRLFGGHALWAPARQICLHTLL